MATLQDLFNELQADTRIKTPNSFEDFQSKMESPEYAEKVNNVLVKNGYDTNAYEGLKKKEESMVDSAPLSQQESEQPSETTEPTQTVGTDLTSTIGAEPIVQNEINPTQADFSAYKIDVKPSKFLSGDIPTQSEQPSQVVASVDVNQNINTPIATPDSKHSSLLGLAKKAKNKFSNKFINPIFSQVNEATAEFSQDVKATEEGVNQVGEGDPKKKEVKDAATSMYNEFDSLNHRQALRILGDTQALGVKMNGDNYEVIFTNSKMGGKDQGRTYKGVIGDATWNGYVSNNMESTDLYTDENAWEDLKSAVITQDTYTPEIEGSVLKPNFNNNLAAHKSKYFPKGKVGQITGTVTVPAENKKEEKNLPFGTDLKRLAEKIKIKVKTSEIINEDKEENKIYNIAQETIPLTEYVLDTEQSFYSSLNNTPETNAIMEANALSFSDVLLPSVKSKEKVTAGINTFLEKAGYDQNEINQKSGIIYKEMLRDARYHAAEQYIRHEIEIGNKTFKQQDIDRLFQAKELRVDEIKGDNSLITQSDQGFVSNLWDVSLSDYTNHYDAKATVRGRNMDIKNIPGKVSAFTQRMNELNAQIEAEKINMQLPSEEQLGQSVQEIKNIKQKVDAYDTQLSQIDNEIKSLLVEQDGKQYLKDENSRQKYEELTNQSNQILSERNALAEQSKSSYQDIEKADTFQKKVSRQVKEYNALAKKINYYDDDPDLLVMKGLSNTLTSIEDYEKDKSIGVKNDLYDFEEYRQKKSEEEAAIKADAEDDTVIEASWKGVTGGVANAFIGMFKTGIYASEAITGNDNVWDGGDAGEAAVSQLQENISTWAFNPNYEKWGLNWFVNGAAGAVPDLAAVYLTGGGAGFAELAATRGVVGALGTIAISPTTVYFTMRSTGDYAEKLQKAGYSPGEAFLGGGLIAGIEAGLESTLPEFYSTSERIGIKSTFKEVIEAGIAKKLSPKEIAKQLTLSYAKTSRNFGKQVITKTTNESIEEGTASGFTEVSFAVATDETIEIFNPQTGGMGKTLEAITESSAIGGAIGNVGASIQGIRTVIKERSQDTALKLTQLQVGRKYNEIVKQANGLSNEFKGSEVEKEYKKIHEEYNKLASNPNFVKYDDAAKAEVLNMSLTLSELKEAQKNYSSQNIEDVKLNNEINEKEKELATTIGTAQKNADAREEMNKQLEEIGVQSFTLNVNGEINGMTFNEFTTQEEEADIIKKATDIIEKVYKPKPQENAVQKSSTGEVLQREPQETGETGSQRKGVEPVLEGKGATQEVGKEEVIATPQEQKEPEAMQTDIDQVQQSTGTVINLNEDGTLTINAPQKGGQSKKDAAIENAKQELTNLGYNVGNRVVPTAQQEVVQEEVKPEITDEEFDNSIKEAEGMGVVAGTQSMNDLQTRTAQDPKKGKIVSQASRAVKALQSLFPNMNLVLHENQDSYNNAMQALGGAVNTRGQFVYKPNANGEIQGAIHINLDKANARTIAHEVTHAALLKMFKGDGKVFGNFKDKLKDIAKNQQMVITDKDGNQVETTWGDEAEKLSSKYQTEEQAEEYLSELAGLVAEMDVNNPVNKSILQKIAEFINKFILSNPQLNALGIKPISDTSSAEEVLEFFDTLGKKISRGEEIKTDNVNEVGEESSSNEVKYKLQNDFSDPVSRLTFMYDKNSDEFKKLQKQGYITNNKRLRDFAGKYLFLHQPDAAFSGMIYKNGELLVEGKGGVFYPIKFHKDGYFWASTDTTANKMAKDLNAVLKQNGGTIYMALTSAPYSKLMSSTTMSNAVLDFFSSKAVDRNFKINSKQLKLALLNASNHTKVKTTKNKKTGVITEKKVGLDLGLSDKSSLETIKSKIKEALGPDNSSFDDRKTFVLELTRIMAEEIKNDPSAVKQFGKLFSDGIQNKYFKGENKTGKLKISAANMVQAMSEMFTEPMLKEGVDRSKGGQVYAVLELKGKVKPVDSDKHESYPKAIQSDSDAKVKLHILKDRENWYDNFEDPTTGEIIQEDRRKRLFPTSGVSTMGLRLNPPSKKAGVVAKSQLSDEESNIANQVAGNAKSIMDTTGVSQAEAVKQAVLEIMDGDQESADRYLAQLGIKEAVNNKIKQIKAKTERELEAQSPDVTMSERKLLLDRVKAEIKAALEGRKEGKKEGVEQAKEQAQKTIDALNKKLEEGKITKQELQDRIKELGYNIRFEAGVARLAGEKTGKSMGKKFGEFVGYFKGLKAGRTEQRGLGALVSEYIKDVVDNEFGKKGTVSPATLKSIARRAATISNQKQLDAFVSYLDKVIANRRLAEGLNEIKKLQKQLLNKVGYQYTSNMKMFAKFDMFTADGDLAFDMDTMTKYLDALRDLTSDRVPKIGKMMELFDKMYDINQQNQPNDIDIADTMDKWKTSIDKLFNNTTINDFEDYKKFKREVGKYMRALNTLLETGVISEDQYESSKNKVIEDSAATDTYATEFQDQIDELKKMLIDGITDKSGYGFMDSIKDWLSNSPNSFTENQKKLIDQLMRAKPDNLMTLSLEDLDLLNQVTSQIAEAGFVDEKNLRTLLDRAEIRGNEIGKSLVEQSKQAKGLLKKDRYSNSKNGYLNMMRDTLGKSVVFWESRLGMKENGAFRKHLVDPIVRAINGWEKDSQRILKNYQKKVESLRSGKILKNAPGIGKLINRTKIETFKLTTDGTLVPNGTIKVSKDAYDRVMIGVVGHILDNAWNAKQKKKTVNDWLGKQMLSATERNKMQNEDVNELDIVNNVYNDLKEMFPDGKGGLDHMAVLEAFESDPTSILTSGQLEYYNVVRSTLQEAGEYINSASGMRNQQHELNPYYMPRQSIGTGKAALTSTDISYNKNVGAAIRSGASYQRVLQVPVEAIRYNVDRLVMTNVNEGLRDYYLTEAKRYVNEVFSNAQENANSDEVVMLNNLKQLSDTIAPFALQKSESTFGLSKLMGKFFVDALIGIPRTFIEFATNLLSYAIGNKSSKSITLPFTPKEKQETDKLLTEFDSSVQFTGMEKKVKLRGDKGVDGYLDMESNFGLINKYLNNVTGFMRKGEWKSQFEKAFQNNTGEKFNYEKHFVKEKGKYYDDMSKSASDADFRMRRIMKGGNKAEQRQFIQWLPLVSKARISADSKMAAFVGMFSGFINHDADNLNVGLRKTVTQKEIKDGLTQALGAYSRLALYPVLMVIGKAVANLNLGDDDEKEEAQETLDSLKTPQGWIDMAIFSAKQVAATFVGGKFAAGGKVVGSLFLDAAYTMSTDRRQRRLIEDTMRELYFVDPIDFYDLPSEKDDIALQISANLEPIIGMTVNAVADFVKDVRDKGREQVTLYDIYEWTQQTDEGKQWMYMTNSIATLSQTLTVMFTPGAIPLIDDYVRWAEDKLSQKEIDSRTEYELPNGKKIDMQSLILNNDDRLDVEETGISSREKDKYSEIATEKFKKSIDEVTQRDPNLAYLKLKFLAERAKYETSKELGYNYKRWDAAEEDFVDSQPIWENYLKEDDPRKYLYEDIMKGKEMSYVQNIKDKRRAEDFMFKSLDENPEFKQKYKDGTDGGKKGVRDYYKALYLYNKYQFSSEREPKERDYFIEEDGQIKANPNRSKYEEKD